jgi:hypothetical protein
VKKAGKMPCAAGKPALQKKSPGTRPGRSFLQEKSTTPIIPLSRGTISMGRTPAMDPRFAKSPAKFRACGAALYRIPLHASTSYIYYSN